MPLQEIIDWLGQKDEELSAQLPLRGDVLLVQQEKETHAVRSPRSPVPCSRLLSLILTGTSRFPEQKSLTQQAAPQKLQLVEQERTPQPQTQPQLAVNGLWGTLLLPSSFPLHCRNVSLLTPLCISSEGWVLSSGSVSLMSPWVVRLGTG